MVFGWMTVAHKTQRVSLFSKIKTEWWSHYDPLRVSSFSKKLVASLLWGLTTPFFIDDYANL